MPGWQGPPLVIAEQQIQLCLRVFGLQLAQGVHRVAGAGALGLDAVEHEAQPGRDLDLGLLGLALGALSIEAGLPPGLLNIVTGKRYSAVPDEVIQYAAGYYGQPPAPIDAEAMDRIMSAPRAKEILATPPEQPDPSDELAVAGQTLASQFHATVLQAVSALAQQTVMLRKSRRFDGPIGQLALAVNAGDANAAWACFEAVSDCQVNADAQRRPEAASTTRLQTARPLLALQPANNQVVCELAVGRQVNGLAAAPSASYAEYLQKMRDLSAAQDAVVHAAVVAEVLKSFDRFRILCAVHQGDWGTTALNAAVQKTLADAGWLKPQGEWFAGRPVMVTRNDTQLGVFNGDVGVVLPNPQGVLKAWFLDGEQLRSVSVSRLAHAETAFVMTVHKSQGSEFEHTALVLPPGAAELLSRELVYTGITRARQQFTLIEGQAGLLDAAILARLENTWPGREEGQRSPAWVARQMDKIQLALSAMARGLGERSFCSGTHFSLADIAVGCALGYLDFRFAEIPWRADHPNLAKLQDKLMLRASFADTAPS